MADKGIIFSPSMVRALLDGRKTQTRRLCAWTNNPLSPALTYIVACDEPGWFGDEEGEVQFRVPYAPGDWLYVREAWTARMAGGWTIADARSRMYQEEILYRADGVQSLDGWWPSVHMPREFSRLWLAVTDVRVQRVQEISREDVIAEGISERDGHPIEDCVAGWHEPFAALWNSLHTKPGETWDDNPWVVAVTFAVHRGNIDQVPS